MLDDIRIFVKVLQLGGFSSAARQLKLPTSTVSRTISRLEDRTGTKLLVRTTRSLKATAAGLAFYESCTGPIQALEDASLSLSGQDSMLTGLVRLTAPEDIGEHVVSPLVGTLVRNYPGLTFELLYNDDLVDLVGQGFDIAIRIGRLKTSSLVARRVGDVTLIIVASSGYLDPSPPIRLPKDLQAHDTLSLAMLPYRRSWALTSGKRTVNVEVQPKVTSNQMTSLVNLAVQGAGLAYVPRYLCRRLIEERKLVHVLPSWSGVGLPVSIVSTPGTSKAIRNKTVIDHLADEIGKRLA